MGTQPPEAGGRMTVGLKWSPESTSLELLQMASHIHTLVEAMSTEGQQ